MSGTSSGVAISKSGDDINLQIYRGKTLNFNLIWGGSTPIDITGYEASMQARSVDGDIMMDMSTSNGGITINGPAGKLSFIANSTLTSQVTKTGRYEVEMTNTYGDIYRVISGSISPIDEVVL